MLPFAQSPASSIKLIVSTGVPAESVVEAVRGAVHSLDPNLPVVGIETMAQRVRGAMRSDRFNLLLVGAFAAIAIALASVGIYGVMAHAIAQRTHGVRGSPRARRRSRGTFSDWPSASRCVLGLLGIGARPLRVARAGADPRQRAVSRARATRRPGLRRHSDRSADPDAWALPHRFLAWRRSPAWFRHAAPRRVGSGDRAESRSRGIKDQAAPSPRLLAPSSSTRGRSGRGARESSRDEAGAAWNTSVSLRPRRPTRAGARSATSRSRARRRASVWIWPWLDSVRQDAAYALRSLRRNPGFSAAVILVTSLGIAATTSVFGLIDGLVLKPLPVRDPGRLVYFAKPGFSYPIFSETRARGAGMFSGFFAWNLESVNVDWNGQLEPAEVLMATGDFYSTLGVQAALGRTFNADDDRPGGGASGLVAVISHGCWQRRFGSDGSVIGRIVRIDRRPFTIVGVAPRGFFGVAAGLAPDITIPLTAIQDSRTLTSTTSAWLHLMGRLRDGVSREQANVALKGIWPAVLEVTTNPGAPADRRAKYLGRQTELLDGSAGFSRVRQPVRRTSVDSLRARRAVVRRRVRQRSQLAAGSRRRASARDRGAAGDWRQPCQARATALDRIAGVDGDRRRPRRAPRRLGWQRARRHDGIPRGAHRPRCESELAGHAVRAFTDARHRRDLFGASRAARHSARPGFDAQGDGTSRRRNPPALVAWQDARRLPGGGNDGAAGGSGALRAQPRECVVRGRRLRPRPGARRRNGCGSRRIWRRAIECLLCAASRAARRPTGRRINQPVDDAADQQRGRQLDAEHSRRWRADGGGSVALCAISTRSHRATSARWACACCADATSGSPMRRRPRGWSSSTSRWRAGSSRTRIRSGA